MSRLGAKPLENLESFENTNGDGTLLYPAEIVGGVGPMPSIRLMLLRDAIEDYELGRTQPTSLFLDKPTSLSKPAAGYEMLMRAGDEPNGLPVAGAFVQWESKGDTLGVGIYLSQIPMMKDYVAVELAPRDASEKWRFIVTTKGNKVVERRTREGAFRLPDFPFEGSFKMKSMANIYPPLLSHPSFIYSFKIPLQEIPWAKDGVRFNLLWQPNAAQITLPTRRFSNCTNDPFTWPLLTVAK